MSEWTVESARGLAFGRLGEMGDRWRHVQQVARTAERLVDLGAAPSVAIAAWLHDVGYSPSLIRTGLHPLDGARFLLRQGAPSEVVSLVAFHSGAEFEAEERGLGEELSQVVRPNQEELDALTFSDMTTGPDGVRMSVDKRLAEILGRYPASDPVHRAITASSPYIRECVARAQAQYAEDLRV